MIQCLQVPSWWTTPCSFEEALIETRAWVMEHGTGALLVDQEGNLEFEEQDLYEFRSWVTCEPSASGSPMTIYWLPAGTLEFPEGRVTVFFESKREAIE